VGHARGADLRCSRGEDGNRSGAVFCAVSVTQYVDWGALLSSASWVSGGGDSGARDAEGRHAEPLLDAVLLEALHFEALHFDETELRCQARGGDVGDLST